MTGSGPAELVLSSLLFVLRVLNFAIRFAIENHLRPSVILFENADDIFVMEVSDTTRVHESAILQAIILELLLVLLRDAESFEDLIILKLQTGLRGAILNHTQHLQLKDRALYEAPVSANVFIADLRFANITFVLDLYEVDFDNEAAHLNDMPNDVV